MINSFEFLRKPSKEGFASLGQPRMFLKCVDVFSEATQGGGRYFCFFSMVVDILGNADMLYGTRRFGRHFAGPPYVTIGFAS